jgi:hypothetical protein
MSADIIAVEVQETKYDEVVVLETPYDAKDFIDALPWNTLEEEEEEHGDLRTKLENRDVADAAIQAAEDFNFSDTFSAHQSWDPNALGRDNGAWTIDRDALGEALEFFEFCGFEVENNTNV